MKQSGFGLIGDRPFLWKIGGASGKSFTSVIVEQLGGPGIAIALPRMCRNLILLKCRNLAFP